MAVLHNQQPVIGVRLLSEGATLYNNCPVIGVRAATGLVFTDNQIVRGVEVIDDDRPLYNGQPVVGAVMIDDDRELYNFHPILPVAGGIPSWVTPGPDGTLPTDLADYAGNRGWYDGHSYGSIDAYLAGASGTFSRGSGATYFDASGILRTAGPNVLRLDHDPITGKALGVRLEGAGTNDWLWFDGSQSFGAPPAAYTPKGTIAPSGAMDATVINAVGSNSARYQMSIPAGKHSSGQVLTLQWCQQRINYTGTGWAAYPGSFLAVTNSVNMGTTGCGKVADLAGGWELWEASVQIVDGAVSSILRMYFGGSYFSGGVVSGADPFAFWGIDLKASPIRSSLVYTAGNPAQRLADSLTFARAAPPEGTVVIEGRTPLGTGGNQVLWQWDDGTDASRYRLVRVNDGNLRAIMTVAGVDVVDLDLGPVANDADLKVVLSWRSGQFAASLNGAAAVVDTSYTGPLPVVSTVRCGSGATSGDEWFGTFACLGVFDRSYSPAELPEVWA